MVPKQKSIDKNHEASGLIGCAIDADMPDVATRIMERMVRMPPKQHKDMKLGKVQADRKERPASKGRVHKGKSRD